MTAPSTSCAVPALSKVKPKPKNIDDRARWHVSELKPATPKER